MNGSQKAVLWIGLILIFAGIALKWSVVRSVIFGTASTTTAAAPAPTILVTTPAATKATSQAVPSKVA